MITLLFPYFGKWPEWFPFYLASAAANAGVKFVFFSDCGNPRVPLPANCTLYPMNLGEFNELYLREFPGHRVVEDPYKICDIRPAFGVIFRNFVRSSLFWGWGDLDVIYGDLLKYLRVSVGSLDRVEAISFYEQHMSGNLSLFSRDLAASLHTRFPDWNEKVNEEKYMHLDEPSELVNIRVYFHESYNTPLSPFKPWTDGTFRFPAEWTWQDGILTNDLDSGREFSHLHFMHWKGGEWARQCGNAQWERLSRLVNGRLEDINSGFRINELGFWAGQSRSRLREGSASFRRYAREESAPFRRYARSLRRLCHLSRRS
jgi:hypothetical protein